MNQYQETRERGSASSASIRTSRTLVKEIRDELKNVEIYLYWAINPEEKDGGAKIIAKV